MRLGVCGVAPKLVLHHKSLVSSAPGHHKPLTHPFHPLPHYQNTESARFAPHSVTQRPQNSPSRPDSRRISGSRSAGGSVSTPPPARPPRIYQNRSETGRSEYLAAPPASPRHAPDVIIQYPLTIQLDTDPRYPASAHTGDGVGIPAPPMPYTHEGWWMVCIVLCASLWVMNTTSGKSSFKSSVNDDLFI